MRPEGVANAAVSPVTFRTSAGAALVVTVVAAGVEVVPPLGKVSEMLTLGAVEALVVDVVGLAAVVVGDAGPPGEVQPASSAATPTMTSMCLRERMAPSMRRRGSDRELWT
jgi:hypothetical protein